MANEAQFDVSLVIRASSKQAQAAFRSIGQSLKGLEAQSRSAQKSLEGIGSSLRSTGRNLSLFLTTPLLAAGAVAVKSFGQQQEAVELLNQSLKNAGTFSKQASQDLQSFASALQRTSTFGDEVILQNLALARNFTQTNEQAKALTQAAVELSAATGKPLESSITNLGKTFAGLAGELGESVPALRDLTQEQLRAGAAIDLVSKRFAGSALASSQTFNGQIVQLRNSFGDFLELLGAELAPIFSRLVSFLRGTVETLNSLDAQTRRVIIAVAAFAAGIGPALIALGLLSSGIAAGIGALRGLIVAFTRVAAILAGPVGVGIAIAALVASVAGLVNLFLELQKVTQSSAEAFLLAWKFASSNFDAFVIRPILVGLQKVYDVLGRIPGFAGQVFRDSSNFLQGFIDNIDANKAETDQELARVFEGTGQSAANAFTFGLKDKLTGTFKELSDSFKSTFSDPVNRETANSTANVARQTTGLAEDARRTLQSIGGAAVSNFSSAFQSISDGTKSASEGFKDFARSAIDSIQRIVLEAALLRALGSAFPAVFGTPQVGGAGAGAGTGVATGGFFGPKGVTHRFAEGGMVRGPGTGTSDSILARISNGEFVSDAKTVSHFGPDFFVNLKRMARGMNTGPSYSNGLPAFQNGGLVQASGGQSQTRVMIENSGSPKEAQSATVEQDAQGTVVRIVLDDLQRNGNIAKGFQSSFGLRRSGV